MFSGQATTQVDGQLENFFYGRFDPMCLAWVPRVGIDAGMQVAVPGMA
jgi:hypothetical protein